MDSSVQQELQRVTSSIEQHAARLHELDADLAAIEEQNRNDDVGRQIQQYNETALPAHEVAAEDAMDSIVRMQNQLKIVRRRNQLLARENAAQEKQLRDRAKRLEVSHKELDTVKSATGWHGGKRDVELSQVERDRADIHDMALVEAALRSEIKSGKVTIARLEKTALMLHGKVQANEERRSQYLQLRNNCQVREKECSELQARAHRVAADNNKLQLVVQTESDSGLIESSVAVMESDREFLTDAVQDLKAACRRQENIVKAQVARQQQLQHRLDTVMKALQEMRLAREFERSVTKSALVPSAPSEEPEDVAQVLPENESIPVDTFRLLYKNNEMMRTNVARKNMLVLEKESAVQSMEAKVLQYVDRHNEIARYDESMQMSSDASVRETQLNLSAEEKKLALQIEELRMSNHQMRTAISKKLVSVPSIGKVAPVSRRRK